MKQPSFRTEHICTSCGLCCAGIVHTRVALRSDELQLACKLSLKVAEFPEGLGFHLPCPQYRENHCAAYSHRPRACMEYECELLRRVYAGETTFDEALQLVVQAREMVVRLWAEAPDRRQEPITFERLRELVARHQA